jgi:type VI secretion system secreted protein Hcp
MGIYMQYGDIVGDATQTGFERWININSFIWPSIDRKGMRTETGRSRNREPGQPVMGVITVSKAFDHATGLLLKALCTVPQAKTCKIAFVRTDEGGDCYLQYTLTDALLANLDLKGRESDRPDETWTIDFTELEIEVKQLNEANESGPSFHYGFNSATGKSKL